MALRKNKGVEQLSPDINNIVEINNIDNEIRALEVDIQEKLDKIMEYLKYKKEVIENILVSEKIVPPKAPLKAEQ